MGQVGVAEHAVHGPVVDSGLEQVDEPNLLVAEKYADEGDGQDDDHEEPSR